MADAEVSNWSATPSGNAAQSGMPMNEGMQPAQLNDSIRGIMAAVRRAWIDIASLSNLTPTQIAAWIVTLGVAKNDLSNVDPATGRAALGVTNANAAALFAVGDVKITMSNTIPTGWVRMDGTTVGNASSNATARANADCQALFTLLWNENSALVIYDSSGTLTSRGGSALADWNANKALSTPNASGQFFRIIDLNGVVDSLRKAGNIQAHQVQSHNHAVGLGLVGSPGTDGAQVYGDTTTASPGAFTTHQIGTQASTPNRQPYTSTGSPVAGSGSGVGPVGTFGSETRPTNMSAYAYIFLG